MSPYEGIAEVTARARTVEDDVSSESGACFGALLCPSAVERVAVPQHGINFLTRLESWGRDRRVCTGRKGA
jgi:hypothetical protein